MNNQYNEMTHHNERTRERMQTVELSREQITQFQRPPFQRPIVLNSKMHKLIQEYRNSMAAGNPVKCHGVVLIGIVNGVAYLVDGQHRVYCFLQSGAPTILMDLRTVAYASIDAMAREYVEENGKLVVPRTDDKLRALEFTSPHLQRIRQQCPFVGYSSVRRSASSPVVSAYTALSAWSMSRNSGSQLWLPSPETASEQLDTEETTDLISFLQSAFEAFGHNKETRPLWFRLNLTMCALLFRRMVRADVHAPEAQGMARVDAAMFVRCMGSVATSKAYLDWIGSGQRLDQFTRGPAYRQICKIVQSRLRQEHVKPSALYMPYWASGLKEDKLS